MWKASLILAALVLGQAEAPPSRPLAEQVRSLVRQLNARRSRQREAAETKLLELGPDVLDLLPDQSAPLPAEVQTRLDRVRNRLQIERAARSADASRVTLHGRMSLLTFFEALEKQTGNRIVDLRDRFGQEITNPEIDVDFDRTPFWQALDDVLARTDTTVYPFPGEAAVAIVNREAGQTPRNRWTAYAGAFRIEAVELLARRDLRHGGRGTLRLRYQVSWEPRLRPIAVRQPLAGIRLVVNGQNVVADVEKEAVIESQTRRGTIATDFDVPLKLPSAKVDRIERLEGRLQVLLPSSTETFRFADLKEGYTARQRKGTTTVTLENVTVRDGLTEVRVVVAFDQPGEALESHRGWIFQNEAFLETPDAERIDPATLETTRQSPREVGVAYLFAVDKPDGHRFVYKTPVLIQTITLDYHLTNLPLP